MHSLTIARQKEPQTITMLKLTQIKSSYVKGAFHKYEFNYFARGFQQLSNHSVGTKYFKVFHTNRAFVLLNLQTVNCSVPVISWSCALLNI